MGSPFAWSLLQVGAVPAQHEGEFPPNPLVFPENCVLSRCCCLCLAWPCYAPGITTKEDNCCGCNVLTIWRHFLDENVTSVDIVYTSCHDNVYETPFYVAVDHNKKKVVISI
ncbi:hypothetical protein WISP_81378 [Willisornis vidua]|uniref:Uncharacterized protein n=1 Tax=Willisornis vidua TaxID=1566151 RepID=A0ABQ9DA75_9PASS|nr:hypothetical protein WISP_81378 [Willisornis vidua]